MRHALLKTILGLLTCLVPLVAQVGQVWREIPAEVWAVKQDGGKVGNGAVILDEWIRYGVMETEVRKRIRIFSEEGKQAAAIPVFSRFYTINGWTSLPDGTATRFDSSKDLVKGSISGRGWDIKMESFIPPGLTSNCVVDFYYRVPTELKGEGGWLEIPVLESYPVKKKVMEMAATGWDCAVLDMKGLKLEKKPGGSYNVYTFADLPPEEAEPYSLPTTGERPRFAYFFQPRVLSWTAAKSPEAYWKEVGEKAYKPVYTESLRPGRDYKKWSQALRAGLEGDPAAKAATILARLEATIQNGSQLSYAEWAALKKEEAAENFHERDLDEAIQRKRTSGTGMHYLFYQLLVDEGLQPMLLLAADRNKRFFRYQLPILYQLDDVLIGVATANGVLVWFQPAARYTAPGLIHPAYQGTQGLLLNPKDWSCKPFAIGIQAAIANRSIYEFNLDLNEEETFSLRARFLGYPEFAERSKYLALEPKEQDRKLKEAFEANSKAYTLTKATVENATDGRKNLTWAIEGRKEAEEGRRRVFSPFPGLRYPVSIPAAWPDTRKNTIVLPFCQQLIAFSRFKVPKGCHLGKDPDFVQSNEFGSVRWLVKETGEGEARQVEVTYFVEVNRMYAPATSYAAFREFLGWIESASRRTLALDRQS
jgi:hypothetical protein